MKRYFVTAPFITVVLTAFVIIGAVVIWHWDTNVISSRLSVQQELLDQVAEIGTPAELPEVPQFENQPVLSPESVIPSLPEDLSWKPEFAEKYERDLSYQYKKDGNFELGYLELYGRKVSSTFQVTYAEDELRLKLLDQYHQVPKKLQLIEFKWDLSDTIKIMAPAGDGGPGKAVGYFNKTEQGIQAVTFEEWGCYYFGDGQWGDDSGEEIACTFTIFISDPMPEDELLQTISQEIGV